MKPHITVDWIYSHFRPFLKRMSDKDGWEALRECVDREFISEEQFSKLIETWSENGR
jgi:hypothetical protein